MKGRRGKLHKVVDEGEKASREGKGWNKGDEVTSIIVLVSFSPMPIPSVYFQSTIRTYDNVIRIRETARAIECSQAREWK